MKVDNEFQKIGKRIPYEVPDGFFEKITEKTLQQAKLRDPKYRKSRILWRTMSVAASLAAALLLGYMILYPDIKSESNQLAIQSQPVGQQLNHKKQETTRQSTVTGINKTGSEQVPENKTTAINQTEGLSAVLADLTDEELQQMATMLKTDPFINESAQ